MENENSDFLTFRSGMTNIYLLPFEENYILIDTGVKKREPAFFAFLNRHDIVPDKIDYIFLTHTHYDHTGGISLIKEMSHAKIMVHTKEAGYLRQGFTPVPRGSRASTKVVAFLGRHFFKNLNRYTPTEPDIVWEDEPYHPEPFPAQAIHTPGHTSGSSTLIWKEKMAFVGDTLFGIEKEDCFPWFVNDTETLGKSWEKLLDSSCEMFYPAHGKPVTRARLERSYRKHFRS
ncbi:MAG TPA: MBL fold metallo-hydrolase [Bacteroidetes bacterium]|nr:MBL fold metallo-hydrolase [Bacteroidota bacterium]